VISPSTTTIFAVVPQVDSPPERPQQGVADRQGRGQVDAGIPHGPPVVRTDHDLRAEVVGHGPAGDASSRGALQRLDDLAAVVVRQPDVEEQMDVVLGGVDVRDHGVDGGVGVREQVGRVAADRAEPADRMPEVEEMLEALRDLGLEVCLIPGHSRRELRHAIEYAAQPGDPPTADVYFAKEQIGGHPRHRHSDNDDHPGDTRGGLQ
jgi:hypothetical protein